MAIGFQIMKPVMIIMTVPHTSDQYSIFSVKVYRPICGAVLKMPRLYNSACQPSVASRIPGSIEGWARLTYSR